MEIIERSNSRARSGAMSPLTVTERGYVVVARSRVEGDFLRKVVVELETSKALVNGEYRNPTIRGEWKVLGIQVDCADGPVELAVIAANERNAKTRNGTGSI